MMNSISCCYLDFHHVAVHVVWALRDFTHQTHVSKVFINSAQLELQTVDIGDWERQVITYLSKSCELLIRWNLIS